MRKKVDLVCQHCKKTFQSAYKDRKYCSKLCANRASHDSRPRHKCRTPGCEGVVIENWNSKHGLCKRCYKRTRKGPHKGICKLCGAPFSSKEKGKIYCSMTCYTSDPEAKARLTALNKARGGTVNNRCVNCNRDMAELKGKPSKLNKKKYCSQLCRREYFASRFDRWIANPETIALPQCYDEFLTKEELPCLIDGCDWVGQHLGHHVNFAHGISAEDFKKLVGFNKGTGLVTPELHRIRSEISIEMGLGQKGDFFPPGWARGNGGVSPSLEAKEHCAKARALIQAREPESSKCEYCGNPMLVGPMGKTKRFCSVECRSESYNEAKFDLVCGYCKKEFKGNRLQERSRRLHGNLVACSGHCKGKMNSPYAVAARRKNRERRLREQLLTLNPR